MPRVKRAKREVVPPPLVPASTPEGREQQLTALAYDLAEERMRNGTASSAEVVHFLKLSTVESRLKEEKLKHETELMAAKTESIKNAESTREMMEEAMRAMKHYNGADNYSEETDDTE
jgi:hypothetical protein